METKAALSGNINSPDKDKKMPIFKPFIFVSYAHEDYKWFENESLMPRLIQSLEHNNAEIWYDKLRIGGSDIWREEIEKAIDQADIAIVLVSQFFINSDFIMQVELPRLIKRAEEKQLIIFPILVGYCNWESIEAISRTQMMPGEPTPLVEYLEPLAKWERVQHEIYQALLRKIGKLKKEREGDKTQAGLIYDIKPAQEPGTSKQRKGNTIPTIHRSRPGWFDRIGNLHGVGWKKNIIGAVVGALLLVIITILFFKLGSKTTDNKYIPPGAAVTTPLKKQEDVHKTNSNSDTLNKEVDNQVQLTSTSSKVEQIQNSVSKSASHTVSGTKQPDIISTTKPLTGRPTIATLKKAQTVKSTAISANSTPNFDSKPDNTTPKTSLPSSDQSTQLLLSSSMPENIDPIVHGVVLRIFYHNNRMHDVEKMKKLLSGKGVVCNIFLVETNTDISVHAGFLYYTKKSQKNFADRLVQILGDFLPLRLFYSDNSILGDELTVFLN